MLSAFFHTIWPFSWLMGLVSWWRETTSGPGLLWSFALASRDGRSLESELDEIIDGSTGYERQQLLILSDALRGGDSLGDALAKTRGLLAEDTILLIRLAEEQSADISEVLVQEAARSVHKRTALSTYNFSPTMIFLYLFVVPMVLTTILSGIVIFIVPKFKKIFDDFGSELPELTTTLIHVSDFVGKYWYIGFIAFLASFVFFNRVWKRFGLGAIMDFHAIRDSRSTRWKRFFTLKALKQAVVDSRPVQPAVKALAADYPDPRSRTVFTRIASKLRTGDQLWPALKAEKLITKSDAELLDAAQDSGNLPWALDFVLARHEDAGVQKTLRRLEYIQPTLAIVIGCVIAFVVIALYLPIVDLINDLS